MYESQACSGQWCRPWRGCTCQTVRQLLQVRAAAYRAMAAYSLDALEALELAQPCGDFAHLLLGESDAQARAACEPLVVGALQFEHARRQR